MKRLFTIIAAILFAAILWAQSPQKMSYQAVIRNSSDQLVTNHVIGMRISILQGSSSGTVVYTETQTPTTNANGLVSIEIGGGAGFDAINWANYTFFIKTETDPLGGTSYTITGTSQILSVPYALHAKTVASYPETDPVFVTWNKSSGISITASQVSDFQTSVTNNASMLLNTAKNSYPTTDQTKLAAITGTNTGDETTATIKTKLGITTLSGSNTGDQTLASVLTRGTDAGNNKIINVNQQGIGTAAPDASAALEISSTTKGFLPPRLTLAQIIVVENPTEGLVVYNTDKKTLNVFNGTKWIDMQGNTLVKIGESYAGGLVFYIDGTGIHGLACSPSDISTLAEWGCYGTLISGADGTSIGTGNQNTTDILNGCATLGIAARICRNYSGGGHNDWFLPSIEELHLIYTNLYLNGFGELHEAWYWSSSEFDKDIAKIFYFTTGLSSVNYKPNTGPVRAIRAF
jgi:hypothetical protein